MDDDPCRWSVARLQTALDDGVISDAELHVHLTLRAEQARTLNPVAHGGAAFPDPPGRPASGPSQRLPLRHVPVVVKDSIDTAELPTTAGTGSLSGMTPARDAPTVARLRAAGALVVGKATMHELSYGVTSDNAVSGTVRNPYDPSLIPGGSSGGTAVAVATGLVPVGLGADTGGSVRLPAALCGVVGFRPTVGRYPAEGVVPLAGTRDTVGAMARSVTDVRLVDAVLAGEALRTAPAPMAQAVRLGVPRQVLRDLDPDVETVFAAALETLAGQGANLVEVDLDDALAAAAEASPVLIAHEMPKDLLAYLREHDYPLDLADVRAGIGSPDVQRLWDRNAASPPSPDDHDRALATRQLGRSLYDALLERHSLDALVQPTSPMTARPIVEARRTQLRGRQVPTFATFIRHADLAGALGLPGISLPAGSSARGLPVGIELEGRVGRDVDLLALAQMVESCLPPPTFPSPDTWVG